MNSNSVPLALVALEIDVPLEVLADRLGADVNTNDIGLRVIPSEIARAVIAEHRAARQARRDQLAAEREEAALQPHALRERVRALRRDQAAAGVHTNDSVEVGAALAAMLFVDGTRERKLDAAAQRFSELNSGAMPYHPITERG